ncbi:MAG: hypothetical protein ACOCVF_02500 [bacterium]
MKLYKALKLKNKLANEIADLKRKIMQKNSMVEGSIEYYDVNELYEELLIKIDKLVALKNAINLKNVEIQNKIYLLAEYKGMISFLKGIPTKEGFEKSKSFGEVSEYNFVVSINEVQKEKLINDFQEEIDELQETVDHFNYTTDIDFN